jgi:hypothetical protein
MSDLVKRDVEFTNTQGVVEKVDLRVLSPLQQMDAIKLRNRLLKDMDSSDAKKGDEAYELANNLSTLYYAMLKPGTTERLFSSTKEMDRILDTMLETLYLTYTLHKQMNDGKIYALDDEGFSAALNDIGEGGANYISPFWQAMEPVLQYIFTRTLVELYLSLLQEKFSGTTPPKDGSSETTPNGQESLTESSLRMLTRKPATQGTQEAPKNPKQPLKVLPLPPEYFKNPRYNVVVGLCLPGYNDYRSSMDCARREVDALKIPDEEKRTELFRLGVATHIVGMCLTQPDDYSKPYFSAGGDEAGIVLHPGSTVKLYNEIHSLYQTVPNIREPLNDDGVDRLFSLFKSLPEDSPQKNRLRIGFSFLVDMVSLWDSV